MQLIALVGAMALGIGSVAAAPQPASPPFRQYHNQPSKLTKHQARPHAHEAREIPAKYLYRAKYHSRLPSMPPTFTEPSVSIEPHSTTTTVAPLNRAFPSGAQHRRPYGGTHSSDPVTTTTSSSPATSTTSTTAGPRPWGRPEPAFFNGVRPDGDPASRNHNGDGNRGPGHWMTSSSTSCTSHIVSVTLTQTVNVTVTATASMSYHTINGTLVPCSTTSTAITSTSASASSSASASHSHHGWPQWPGMWPRPSSSAAATTQTITLTLSQTRTRVHTHTVTDPWGNPVPVTTDCVINPYLPPVATGTGHHDTKTSEPPAAQPTATVCAKSAPSGAPSKESAYCGVRGRAVEEKGHFLGRFEENMAGEEVTIEGCWQFCDKSSFGASHGCRAYEFHRDNAGTHCNLYGSPVAYALGAVDGRQNSTWFDKDCGNPTDDEKWHTGGTAPRPAVEAAAGVSGGNWD